MLYNKLKNFLFKKEILEYNKKIKYSEANLKAIKEFLVILCELTKKKTDTTEVLILVQKLEEALSWINKDYKDNFPGEYEILKKQFIKELNKITK